MAGPDVVRGPRERDKLTIAEVCADLGISRRTFYEWAGEGYGGAVHLAAERDPARPAVGVSPMAGRP